MFLRGVAGVFLLLFGEVAGHINVYPIENSIDYENIEQNLRKLLRKSTRQPHSADAQSGEGNRCRYRMSSDERYSGVVKFGRKSHRGDERRRGTPIPVAPPRVPTPMPPPGETEKLLQQGRKPLRTPLSHAKNRNAGDYSSLHTASQIPTKIKPEDHPPFIPEQPGIVKNPRDVPLREKPKLDREKLQECKKRLKMKWFHNESRRERQKPKEETLSNHPMKAAENSSHYTGEKDLAASLTCTTIESGRVTPGSRSSDRFASKINNNYNYKYYGFLDSGDETANDSLKPDPRRSEKAAVQPPALRYSQDEGKTHEVTDCPRNKKPMAGKEIVYENFKIESARVEKKVHKLDSRSHLRSRGELKRQSYENPARRFLEYNVRFGKCENRNNDFSLADSSFRDFYNAGVINGSTFEDYGGGLQDGFAYLESKYTYSVTGIPGSLAQSSAAAAFFARASQKLNLSSPHRRKRHASSDDDPDKSTGFSGAIHRTPPPMPPALLRRIGVKEVTGVGKVKVMLKVSGTPSSTPSGTQSFFNVDSRKKQVTLYDPGVCGAPTAPEDRRVGVAAPKMFAFDAIFTQDDSQAEICSTALTDVIHAVINGTDGCLFCFGHVRLGKTTTMLGTPESANTLGIIPCAISWLFRGIHEQKQKTGARFSVRVSAVEVCQPTQQLKDLLAGHANDCEQSPGVYLRDDPLFGTQLQNQSELRVPNAEKAAFYLDAAVNSRLGKEEGRDSHFLYTLHVYQYSVAGKGGVAGGRSRLHLIDLGSCDRGKTNGGIPLSGLGNVLLAIFNGQKHLPYREHKITQLLKECLSSLTCHAAMIAHVSQSSQHYTDTLTTVQLASRIHRMRRKKIKFGGPSGPSVLSNGSSSDELGRHNASTGSSDFDPSSSEQSADTVIYVAPNDDAATDGEHPPVYIPSLNPGDNKPLMNKGLRGPSPEVRPLSKPKIASPAKSVTSHKTTEDKSSGSPLHKNKSGLSSSKSSPVRTISNKIPVKSNLDTHGKAVSSNAVQASRHEEHWIDGPRISKHKVAEARNIILKEHSKKETWIDGPMQKPAKPTGNSQESGSYGFMDNHKKIMIRKWVENQSVHLKQNLGGVVRPEPKIGLQRSSEAVKDDDAIFKMRKDYEEMNERQVEGCSEITDPEKISIEDPKPSVTVSTALIRQTDACLKKLRRDERPEVTACGESGESSEEEKLPPPPLPLLLRYGKDINIGNQNQPIKALGIHSNMVEDYDEEEDEIELEIVEVSELEEPVPMQDSCLQVTEEDIALCMGAEENPLPEVDQESHEEHPLRILSQENLTVVSTFTDSMSIVTDFERCLPKPRYAPPSLFDQPFYPNGPYFQDEYIELLTTSRSQDTNTLAQLAHLHQLYKSKLALANQNSVKSTGRTQSLSMSDVFEKNPTDLNGLISGSCSIYSEPAYRPPEESDSVCNNCRKNIKEEDGDALDKVHKTCEKLSLNCKKNISSLRHPDGASNPNLDEEEKKERLPGNGASKSDFEDENKEKLTPKKKLGEHRRGSSSSPNRKANHHSAKIVHEGTKQNEKANELAKANELLKLNESNIKLNNSPTRNPNSSSRGELRRTNSASTNKSRRIEENEDVTKSATPPPTSSSSPLTQKHLYFNKTCPSNEGSDSGHESNVSPKITKLSGRPRPQAQCESSGYESVVSFTSSLESEVGVKLVREDAEEVHDPGGQSGWWCWCVSGGPTNAQNARRQPQRHPSRRGPLTIPPKSSRPKN